MENIKINNRVYKAREIDFNFICELGENGIDISDMGQKILPTIRVYLAYCMGVSPEIAGDEMNAHMINGGSLTEIVEVFNEKVETSGFFLAINKTTVPEETPKKTTKKTKEV